ncbi:hypothetical protein ACK32U_05660 [Aeromonas dhakensis]|uniref:hypothetical protein n=1 Tax=Aeromonas dhakensis TaxID=196024 RepID=UPI001AAFDFC8|nr:hypothetical protein [Aeromonas dhakensis]MBO2901241.1 hypothetical protein [Aeromonas dhakensis]MBO2994652.1 hypothetical protein [Aeromonas dhakensis]
MRAVVLVMLVFIGMPALGSEPKIICEYKIGFSRSDIGPEEHHAVIVKGDKDEAFTFEGCSTEYFHGKQCAKSMGVPAGARHIKNQKGEVVAEGTCCNSVTNKITSVTSNCRSEVASIIIREEF